MQNNQYPIELHPEIQENQYGSLHNSTLAKIGTYLFKAPLFGIINKVTGKNLDAGENLILPEDATMAKNISNNIVSDIVDISIMGVLSYSACNLMNQAAEQEHSLVNPVNFGIANAALALSVRTFQRITNHLGWE